VLATAAGSAGRRKQLKVLQLWMLPLLLLLLKGHGCLVRQSCMAGVDACSKTGERHQRVMLAKGVLLLLLKGLCCQVNGPA
jgi:hypothetical protein